jgi:hypothetical protein
MLQLIGTETDPSDAFIANKPPISSYFSAIYIELDL